MRKKDQKINKKILFTGSFFILGFFAFPVFASVPSVQTASIDSVSGSCVMLQGYASTNNTNNYSRWFEIKELNKNMKPIAVGQSWSGYLNGYNTNNIGNYQAEARYLSPDTTYVYRAVAQNSEGIIYGQEVSFVTKSIDYTSDAFNGCSEYVPMSTNRDVVVNVDTGTVIPAYSNSLSLGSQGYSSSQYSYGTQTYQQSVNSTPLNQKISSMNASDIGNSSARLNATTYPTQNTPQYGVFLWGTTADLGNSTPRVALGSGASLLLSQPITGLRSGTKYYYQAVIDNQLGTVRSSVASFTTMGNAQTSIGQTISDNSAYVAYNSTPVRGRVVSTTNPTEFDNFQKQQENNSVVPDTGSTQNNNIAAAAFSGNSYSIFPKTFTDWFSIISLLFISVLSYISWKFYMQKKEDELEYATMPEILANDMDIIPQKPEQPAFLPRKYVKDPFYNNKQGETEGNITINTVKSAPPDNLPI